MAYNRRFLLKRVLEVQNIVKEEMDRGSTQISVYRRHIKKKYHISERTFRGWLTIPAAAELKKIENLKN